MASLNKQSNCIKKEPVFYFLLGTKTCITITKQTKCGNKINITNNAVIFMGT